MNRKDSIIIQKVISEIVMVQSLIKGFSEISFLQDEKTQRAVSMTLINIGELVKNLSIDMRLKFPNVPWKAIAGLRDIVAHRYQTIKMEDIWLTVNTDNVSLKSMLNDILSKEHTEAPNS